MLVLEIIHLERPIDGLVAFIRRRLGELGLGQNELARASGLDPGTLGNIMTGKVAHFPSMTTLVKLAKGLRVDVETLAGFAASPRGATVPRSDVRDNTRGITPAEIALMGGHALSLRYYGVVGCGKYIEPCEHAIGMRDVPTTYLEGGSPDDYGVVEADGDSMNLARIFPGMTMLVRCIDYADDGDVVLANVPYQGTTCKRYRVRDDGHWLVAESTASYAAIKMDDEIKIVGVVKKAWLVAEF